MILNRNWLFKLVLGLFVATLPFQWVQAHEGGPQLNLDQYQIRPGEPLIISGGNLGTDLKAQIILIGNNSSVLLGEALCDGHGDFTQTFSLPTDLAPGVYTIQAIDTSVSGYPHMMASVSLQISTTPQTDLQTVSHVFDGATFKSKTWLIFGLLSVLLLTTATMIWRRQQARVVLPPLQMTNQFDTLKDIFQGKSYENSNSFHPFLGSNKSTKGE